MAWPAFAIIGAIAAAIRIKKSMAAGREAEQARQAQELESPLQPTPPARAVSRGALKMFGSRLMQLKQDQATEKPYQTGRRPYQ